MKEEPHDRNQEHGRLAKLLGRRELEFQEQIKAHGGDGFPLNLATIEERVAACERGQCLNCGGHWDALHTHIWKHYHGLSVKDGIQAYYVEHDLPASTSLTTQRTKDHCREGQLARMQGPEAEQIKANLREKSSRPHPERRGFKSWPVAKLISQGVIADEVADKLNLEGKYRANTVNKRAASLGLRGFNAECVFDHGAPFTNGRLFETRRIAGFNTSDEFDRCAGLTEGRSIGARPADTMANPEDALLAMEWRDGVLRELIHAAKSGVRILQVSGKHFAQDQILKTFLPELGELSDALNGTMDRIRREARDHPDWTVDDLCEEICTFAGIEESTKSTDTRWRVTLRYLWQAEEWLKAKGNLARLRVDEVQNSGPLVREMMGSRCGASQWTVQGALKPSTARIEPSDIQGLILRFAPKFANPKPKMGRRPKREHEKEAFKIAAKVNMLIPQLTKQFALLGRLPGKNQLKSAGYTEAQINALLEPTPANDPQMAARRIVAATEKVGFDAVARYHRASPRAGLKLGST